MALIMGALWAAYVATHHQELHGGFEQQQAQLEQVAMQQRMENFNMDDMGMGHPHEANISENHHGAQAAQSSGHGHATQAAAHGDGHAKGAQHSHTGSLANDAMQRLLRGHIHAMGLGVLTCVLLLVVVFTSLKDIWKKVFGFTFGLGAVLYPPAWVIMGFRTVELGPEAAEASIMWLFGPAVGLLIGSMVVLVAVLLIEMMGWHKKGWLGSFFSH